MMHYQPPHYRFYALVCPITTLLAVFNVVIYLHNRAVQEPFFAYPGVVDAGFFLAHFSHWELWHLGFNLIALLYFAPLIELTHRRWLYILALLSIYGFTLTGSWLYLTVPALGFSGVLMGILSYAACEYRNTSEIGQMMLIFLGINLAVGLLPGISFVMHAVGAGAGILTYGILFLLTLGLKSRS